MIKDQVYLLISAACIVVGIIVLNRYTGGGFDTAIFAISLLGAAWEFRRMRKEIQRLKAKTGEV